MEFKELTQKAEGYQRIDEEAEAKKRAILEEIAKALTTVLAKLDNTNIFIRDEEDFDHLEVTDDKLIFSCRNVHGY